MALRSLRRAILRTPDAVSHVSVRALRNLRQPGIAAYLGRPRSRRHRESRAPPRAPRVTLPTLSAQVFFRKAAAPRRAFGSNRAKQVALGRIRDARFAIVETHAAPLGQVAAPVKRAARSVAARYWRTPLRNTGARDDLVARTGIEPVVSALRGRRVKPITLPGHKAILACFYIFRQSR